MLKNQVFTGFFVFATSQKDGLTNKMTKIFVKSMSKECSDLYYTKIAIFIFTHYSYLVASVTPAL